MGDIISGIINNKENEMENEIRQQDGGESKDNIICNWGVGGGGGCDECIPNLREDDWFE